MARRLLAFLAALVLAQSARAAWIDGGATLTAEAGERAIVACNPAAEDCRAEFVDETIKDTAAPGAGITKLLSFGGEFYKRDTGDPVSYQLLTSKDADNKWDAIIDLTGKDAITAQNEWYAAIKNIISVDVSACTAAGVPWSCCSGIGAGTCNTSESSNCAATVEKLPFAIKIKGVFDSGVDSECDFADATDFGDARACLSIFKSDPYVAGLPVPDGTANSNCTSAGTPTACCTGVGTGTCGANFCIIPIGMLTIDTSELVIEMNETGATEPMAALMVGSGYFSGYYAASSNGVQAGSLQGMQFYGPLRCIDNADVQTGWTGADKLDHVPSIDFDEANEFSSTTAICLWMTGAPQTTMNGTVFCDSNATNSDIDDWCFASSMTFSGNFSGIRATGFNGLLLASDANNVFRDIELTTGGGTVPFAIVIGDQMAKVQIDNSCKSTFCADKESLGGSPLISNAIIQAYKHEYLEFNGIANINNIYLEVAAPVRDQVIIGSGRCTSDKSACVFDVDCAAGGTCVRIPMLTQPDCGSSIIANGVVANNIGISVGPCARENDYSDVALERSRAIRLEGTLASFGIVTPMAFADIGEIDTSGVFTGRATSGATDSRPTITLDLSGLGTGFPLPVPASYIGGVIPQISWIYTNNADENLACKAQVLGQFRQKCINLGVTPHSTWICNPANAGASATLCDATADWEQTGGGGGGAANSFQTIDTPSGTDPVADSATDTLLMTCSNGLTCTGSAGADSLAIAIAAGGLADASMATSYSGTGACPANQWVRVLNDAAAGTCSQPAFSDISGTFVQAQIPAAARVQFGVSLDFNADGDPEAFSVADGTGPICTAGLGPCTCFKAPADGSGTQRSCIIANGAYYSGDAEATTAGNFFGGLDNDGAGGAMTCKTRSPAGGIQIRDVNKAAGDLYEVCNGIADEGSFSDKKNVSDRTTTGNLGDPAADGDPATANDGDEFEAYDAIVTNRGAAGAIVLTLPVAVIGECITFYQPTGQDMTINPNGTERIRFMTDANGDAVKSVAATAGAVLTLCATSTSAGEQWAPMNCMTGAGLACSYGAVGVPWADVN